MTNVTEILEPRVLAAAKAIQPLAQRAAGMMPVEASLSEESERVFEDCVAVARAVIMALDNLPPLPRTRGPLHVADAQALRLDIGATRVAVVAWMGAEAPALLATAAQSNLTFFCRLDSERAADLSAAIGLAIAKPSHNEELRP